MNFDVLRSLVQPHLLSRMDSQPTTTHRSVTFYRCPFGHQAAQVTRGDNPFPKDEQMGPNGTCPRCKRELGANVRMR